MLNLVEFLFFAVPIGAIAFFAWAVYSYRSARKEEKAQPGSVSPERLKRTKLLLIIASVIAGVLVVSVVGFVVLLFLAIAYM